MTDTASRKSSTSQRSSKRRETAAAPQLTVRYWKRMRMNKVYPVTVASSGEGEGEGGPLTVRLVMAGAQVVPAEQPMDPADPRGTVTFYVTPLANGYLRGERLEVIQGGHKVQEIRTPSKVTSQKGTLVWFFLAFFIPWVMLHYFRYSPVGYQNPVKDDGTELYVRKPWTNYKYFKVDTQDLLPDRPSRKITEFVKDNSLDLKGLLGLDKDSDIQRYYEQVQQFPEEAYLLTFDYYKTLNDDMKIPLAQIVFVLLLLRAIFSFFARTQARRRVTGKPLPA